MRGNGPGKSCRTGITLMELNDMFPDEQSAREWFESVVWIDERSCPRCDSTDTVETSGTYAMPYWCRGCQNQFSVRIGTVLERSHVSFRQWAFAIYLEMTALKGVSAMKLRRDIGVSYRTAWFMLHRIREAWAHDHGILFSGPVEVDETYVGGKRGNMSLSRRRAFHGSGAVGKEVVVGIKDRETSQVRAEVVDSANRETLHRFIGENVDPGAMVYTDSAVVYSGLPFAHESVVHNVGEYVRGRASTNGIESFWAVLKRAYIGVFHKISPKHLQRYVNQFAGKHGMRTMDTIHQMEAVVLGMIGKRLLYSDLTA